MNCGATKKDGTICENKKTSPGGCGYHSKSTPKSTPKSSPKGTPKSASSGNPKSTPKNAPKGTPKGTPKSAPKSAPKSVPKRKSPAKSVERSSPERTSPKRKSLSSGRVFVLIEGEAHEGYEIRGIYKTREKAEEEGMKILKMKRSIPREALPTCFPPDGTIHLSCDYISIEDWEVE